MYILVINLGGTSTKLAIYDNDRCYMEKKYDHAVQELKECVTVFDQYDIRFSKIQEFLRESGLAHEKLSAVVCRAALLRPIPCGTYSINETMLSDLKNCVMGPHVSNLAPSLAVGIAKPLGIPSFIVDPVTVDEMDPVAKVTGFVEIERESRLHTLNQKAVGRKVAQDIGKKYEEANFVICHLGTGTSIGAHKKGCVVDMCDARGEGPMSAERCGGINSYLILELAYSGKYTRDEMIKKMYSQSGMMAHLGTKDLQEAERRMMNGDEHAKLIIDAIIYQNAKEIGAQAAALSGDVDRIIITGGMANDKYITEKLSQMVSFIAPVVLVPGEEEMKALALGAYRVLCGEESAKEYTPQKSK